LRDRREDIPVLLDHFLRMYGPDHQISDGLRQMLLEYDWPGNVRELENCVQRMVAINSGPILHPADAPSSLYNSQAERATGGSRAVPVLVPPESSPSSSSSAPAVAHSDAGGAGVVPLNEMERSAIIHALEYTRGDRMMAAHLLGIGRTTLYRKLKEYNIKV
jgi:DNA-binding NtrC family response regulator